MADDCEEDDRDIEDCEEVREELRELELEWLLDRLELTEVLELELVATGEESWELERL